MILTDREIRDHIKNGQIVIDPPPDDTKYSATTVDLVLWNKIREWTKEHPTPTVFPGRPGYSLDAVLEKYTKIIDITDGYRITPQQFILAWTAETVHLPKTSKIAARVEGKSSLARIAIGVHVCAPTIHPGFNNKLQLEMCNHGTVDVELVPGMKICQLIFETTFGTPEQGYAGQFQGKPAAPRG
jgi:dCTP deaminase